MAHDARTAIEALRQTHEELVGVVDGLGPDGLTGPSACSEWTVAQVLSHLGSSAEIGLATLGSGTNDMEAAKGIWARWDAMGPDEQAASFLTADERYVAGFEALDDGALADRTFDLGFLPAPVGAQFLASMRLSEVGLHHWDIAVGSDAAATVLTPAVPFALDIMATFAGFFAKPSGRSGQVAVRTADPAASYLLTLTESGADLAAEEGGASSHLDLPAEAFVRLVSGRLAPEHTPASVAVEGEVTLDDLRRCFPGY